MNASASRFCSELEEARCYLKVLVEPLTSAEVQLRAQSELKAGESLVWSGVPDARRAAIAAIPETIKPRIAFLGIGLLSTIQPYNTASSMPKTTSHSLSPMLGMLALHIASPDRRAPELAATVVGLPAGTHHGLCGDEP